MIEYSTDPCDHEGKVGDISFDTHIVNSAGVAVTLFPRRGVHTVSDVALAKTRMRNQRDVVCFYVVWQERGYDVDRHLEAVPQAGG